MRTILKYAIPFQSGEYGRFEIHSYADSKFLHVAMQGALEPRAHIWAEVDPDSPSSVEHLQVVGTGHEVPKDSSHLGTWLDGPYVCHLYALKVSK